ncbi:MAG: glycerol-3-phosphate 1-O-acyltransferase PlsY [Oscillatoria sp. PMC 1051.18]|nr:glycerol-3-phosphate 1-O-acyltransferase PlsY [Oscillatoria sp. PMC 1050.18]MEC5032335.1 glycerol-3-phosphate 1-O-acyltransferase PlsY [Oscillatoria sp. PMC 1051.18]
MSSSFLISGLLILVAYLLGSIPSGYLVGRWLKGIDIREEGSGSTGATNVLRTVGKTAAVVVLLSDLLKAIVPLLLVKGIYAFISAPILEPILPGNWESWLVAAVAIAAIFGHSKSLFLNFTGGKSVASSLGVLLVMNPLVALGTVAVFGIFLLVFRIVSLSSIAGAIAVNIFMIALAQPLPYKLFALFAGLYVIWRHRTNIERLWKGTEPAIGEKLQQE